MRTSFGACSAAPVLYSTLCTAVRCNLSTDIHKHLLAVLDRGRAYRWSYVASVVCSMPGRGVLPSEVSRSVTSWVVVIDSVQRVLFRGATVITVH